MSLKHNNFFIAKPSKPTIKKPRWAAFEFLSSLIINFIIDLVKFIKSSLIQAHDIEDLFLECQQSEIPHFAIVIYSNSLDTDYIDMFLQIISLAIQ